MAKRERPKLKEASSSYFVDEKPSYSFISSGCTLLDCALGGGYPLGRIVNIVGDKSTAKTALATEAIINFLRKYPNHKAAYRDVEATFDKPYAEAMGLPVNEIDFGNEEQPILTVEDFARDFDGYLDGRIKAGDSGIYILDSLDALSDDAEMEQDIGKGTYGMAKAKTLSIMFRKMARKIEKSNVLLIIISQVRDNIGAMFGDKHRRSGGRALDFYCSQILWLAHLKALKREIKKVERPYGVMIRAKVKKNKVGLALREIDFPFIFGYGAEDITASVEWLKEVDRLKDIDLGPKEVKDYLKSIETMSNAEYNKELATVTKAAKAAWREIEISFLPTRTKYA